MDVCTRCGSFVCATCRQIGPDRLIYCQPCAPEAPRLADAGTRFVANLLDNFLFVAPGLVSFVGIALVREMGPETTPLVLVLLGFGTLGTLAVIALQIYYCVSFSQSIAKRLLGIRVVRTDGSPASFARILFLRNVIPQVIGNLCGLFPIIDAVFIFGDQRRCLHDYMADTIVVKV